MIQPKPGEVWWIDFGMRSKFRPLMVVSREEPNPESPASPCWTGPSSELELRERGKYVSHMPMTLDQIVEEARLLPTEQVAELVDRLSERLHLNSGIEESWKAETRRRVADIEAGKVKGIPGKEVSARIRKIVGR